MHLRALGDGGSGAVGGCHLQRVRGGRGRVVCRGCEGYCSEESSEVRCSERGGRTSTKLIAEMAVTDKQLLLSQEIIYRSRDLFRAHPANERNACRLTKNDTFIRSGRHAARLIHGNLCCQPQQMCREIRGSQSERDSSPPSSARRDQSVTIPNEPPSNARRRAIGISTFRSIVGHEHEE